MDIASYIAIAKEVKISDATDFYFLMEIEDKEDGNFILACNCLAFYHCFYKEDLPLLFVSYVYNNYVQIEKVTANNIASYKKYLENNIYNENRLSFDEFIKSTYKGTQINVKL